MTAIWQNDGEGWKLLSPSGFPAEAALHELVEQAPHMLPLAGSPRLIILGREVLLGGNYADLIAVEPSGRIAVIEIKLARNAEARRAVIAQILTYAAYLRGMDVRTIERDILSGHLTKRNYESLSHAASSNDQEGSFDGPTFDKELVESLATGRFRLVLVLDEAPAELVRLVGYLEAVADKLIIDLVTVSAYEIAESQVIVPQRVDPGEPVRRQQIAPQAPSGEGHYVSGADDFEVAIESAPEPQRAFLHRMTTWAKAIEREGLIKLGTYHTRSGGVTLLPRLHADDAGLVTIYNDHGAYLQFWRSVIERRASSSLPILETLALPAKVGQGNTTREVSDDLLAALTNAYREAATGRVQIENQDLM